MDRAALLQAFDEQVRRHPEPDGLGGQVESEEHIVRCIGGPGWIGVLWARLDEMCADRVIAAEIDRFALASRPWEWKHYSYDRPADLPQRLVAAGFTPEPFEALLAGDLAELSLPVAPPAGVELQPVTDERGITALVGVHEEVFREDASAVGAMLRLELDRQPSTVAATVAIADGRPIAAGRVELHRGTEFASLWGDCTVPDWRGRGVFRSIVGAAAAHATAAGMRYLIAEATADSRPIFRRLGFLDLATTTPYVHDATHSAAHDRDG